MPDIEFDGGYLRQNSFHINEAVQDFKISQDQPLNGIRFELANFEAQFKSNDFNYDKYLMKAKGTMDIDIKSIYIAFTEQFNVQTLANGRSLPSFQSVHVVT